MTLPYEAVKAHRLANLLLLICHRQDSGVSAAIRELASKAYRHATEPQYYTKEILAEARNIHRPFVSAEWNVEREAWFRLCIPPHKPKRKKRLTKTIRTK